MVELAKGDGESQRSRTPYADKEPQPRQPRVRHLGRPIRVEGSMPDIVDDPRLDDPGSTPRTMNARKRMAVASILLMLSGTLLLVGGVSLLLSPPAGLVVAGIIVLVVGLLIGFTN